VSAFALTATNPITLLSFLGVFAALGISNQDTLSQGCVLVGGVFAGSAAWWLLLSGGVGLMRRAMEALYLRWAHVIAGALLLAFGVFVLVTVAA
jgi:putative LysE/RhtB family amino acid efflux pump